MPTRRDFDHIGAYNFRVEIDGVNAGRFKRVTGLGGDIDVVEYQDGDDTTVRKRPGLARFRDVRLEKGYVASTDLIDWWELARRGDYTRKNMSIILNDNAGDEILRWNLFECWPKSWELGPLEGGADEVLFESVTVVVEWIEMA